MEALYPSEDPIMNGIARSFRRSAPDRDTGRPDHASRSERSPRARTGSTGFREALVRRVRRQIEAGTYETAGRLERTVEMLLRRIVDGRR